MNWIELIIHTLLTVLLCATWYYAGKSTGNREARERFALENELAHDLRRLCQEISEEVDFHCHAVAVHVVTNRPNSWDDLGTHAVEVSFINDPYQLACSSPCKMTLSVRFSYKRDWLAAEIIKGGDRAMRIAAENNFAADAEV